MELRESHRDADDGGGDDSDKEGSRDVEDDQRARNDKTDYGKETGAAGDVAEVNQCGGIIHDDAAALQADERDEQTDTGSDRLSQRQRQGVHNRLADTRQSQDYEYYTFNKDSGQRELPAIAHSEADRVAEEGVQSHTRGKGERKLGVESHHEGREDGGDSRGGEEGVLVHSAVSQD